TNERGHHTHSLVNFVPNIWKTRLYPAGQGVDDDDNHLAMARNTMACHVEQFPTGTYERAHRHGPGSTIILLDGSGFSMMWPNEDPRIRQIFMDRLAATGAQFKMPESVFKKQGAGNG